MGTVPEHSAMVVTAEKSYNGQVAGTKVAASAAPCNVQTLVMLNTTAAVAFLQMFNKLAADVTVGTTVPDVVIPIAANGQVALPFRKPLAFSVGLTLAGTTTRGGSTGAAQEVSLTLIDNT